MIFLLFRGYTEVDGRYCLMLRNTFKRGVGIVHGSSNTGMYVCMYVCTYVCMYSLSDLGLLIFNDRAIYLCGADGSSRKDE